MIIFCVLIIITLLSYLSLMMLLIGKVLRRFQFEKKRWYSVKVLLACVKTPPPLPLGSWGDGGGVCIYRNQSTRDSGIVWLQKKTVLQHSEKVFGFHF